jgi:hypothetical protein
MLCARLRRTPTLAATVTAGQGMGARAADSLFSTFKTLADPEHPASGFCLTKAATKAVLPFASPRLTHLSFPPEEAIP